MEGGKSSGIVETHGRRLEEIIYLQIRPDFRRAGIDQTGCTRSPPAGVRAWACGRRPSCGVRSPAPRGWPTKIFYNVENSFFKI